MKLLHTAIGKSSHLIDLTTRWRDRERECVAIGAEHRPRRLRRPPLGVVKRELVDQHRIARCDLQKTGLIRPRRPRRDAQARTRHRQADDRLEERRHRGPAQVALAQVRPDAEREIARLRPERRVPRSPDASHAQDLRARRHIE